MGNWMTKMKIDNASYKKQIKELQKQVKSGKTKKEDKTSSHHIIKLKHRISSMKESLEEYRSVIEKYAQENAEMKKGTKAIENISTDKVRLARIRLRKCIKVIDLLDRYLVSLSTSEMARLRDDPGLELYQDVMERFVYPYRKTEKQKNVGG